MKKINLIYKNIIDKYITNKLQKGDIILISTSENFISWLIQRFTKSIWSHIGIYIGEGQWVEATMSKVKISSIYNLVNQYNYRKLRILRLKKELDPDIQNIIINESKKCIGLRCNILGNLKLVLSIIFGKTYFIKHLQSRKQFYCNKFIGEVFSKIGIKFKKKKEYHITIEDIIKSKKLKTIINME